MHRLNSEEICCDKLGLKQLKLTCLQEKKKGPRYRIKKKQKTFMSSAPSILLDGITVKLLHVTWYAGFKIFFPCSRTHALRKLKRELTHMQFSPLGVCFFLFFSGKSSFEKLTDFMKCDTDHHNQNPYCLQDCKVSFSCCHPTHLCTPCEVTFSSYLPRHMTGEPESSNQEDRGRAEGPLSLLITTRYQTERRWNTLQGSTRTKRCLHLEHTGLGTQRVRRGAAANSCV